MYYLKPYKEMLGFSALRNYPNIFCFTTTRRGGVSTGKYASLNGSYFSGDNADFVDQNWTRILSYTNVKPKSILRPYQTHDNRVLCIDPSFLNLTAKEQENQLNGVDALVTSLPEMLITVSTADCVPITIYDPIQKVGAVVHAGWRGTVKRILAKTTQVMIMDYQSKIEDILFCIGPSISLDSFEVGGEVVEEFRRASFNIEDIVWMNPKTQKPHIDLWQANKQQILEIGALDMNISMSEICTYIRHEEFFSARRLGINSGRVITGFMLTE